MRLRDRLQKFIYRIIAPLVHGMDRAGVSPNAITVAGLVLNMGVCALLIVCGYIRPAGDFSFMIWAGLLILFAGLFDMLDGQIARASKAESPFGALLDSVADRYSELLVFGGLCLYLALHSYFILLGTALLAIIGSVMVSYVRARAEGLGVECKGGFMQRPERVVVTGIGFLLCGVAYLFTKDFASDWISMVPAGVLFLSLFFIAVFSNITAISRLLHCRRMMR